MTARRPSALSALPFLLVLAGTLVAPATTLARSQRAPEEPHPADSRTPLVEQRLDVQRVAIVGGDLYPVTAPPIPGGTLLLANGRIAALLPAGRALPQGYRVIHAEGRRVYPGLVAAGAPGLGLSGDLIGEKVGRGKPKLLAAAFDAWADEVELAASGGITTALVHVPSFGGESEAPFAGRAALLKMSFGEPRGALLAEPAALIASRAILAPGGRFAFDEMVRELRRDRKEGKDEPSADDVDLLALLDRRLPLQVDAFGAGDVAAAIDLANTHHLRVVLYLPTEAWSLAKPLADAGIAVVQHVRGAWGKDRDDRRTSLPGGWRFDAPAVLTAAGVATAIVPFTDSIGMGGLGGRDLRDLAMEAAFAERGGLTPQQALEAITIVPARLFDVADRVGSLEHGKDADVIIADGDILDYRTLVRTVLVNGRVAYESDGNRWWSWIAERRDAELDRTGARRPLRPQPPVSPASPASPAHASPAASPSSGTPASRP